MFILSYNHLVKCQTETHIFHEDELSRRIIVLDAIWSNCIASFVCVCVFELQGEKDSMYYYDNWFGFDANQKTWAIIK